MQFDTVISQNTHLRRNSMQYSLGTINMQFDAVVSSNIVYEVRCSCLLEHTLKMQFDALIASVVYFTCTLCMRFSVMASIHELWWYHWVEPVSFKATSKCQHPWTFIAHTANHKQPKTATTHRNYQQLKKSIADRKTEARAFMMKFNAVVSWSI